MNDIGAVLATGLLASLVAIWAVLSQRSITRRQITIEHINRLDNDVDYINAVRRFIELSKMPEGLAKWAADAEEKSKEAEAIRIVLNAHELIAIGIQAGVIEEKMFRQWHQTSVVKYWQRSEPFIKALRQRLNNNSIFIEFELMAKKFSGEKSQSRNWWIGKFW